MVCLGSTFKKIKSLMPGIGLSSWCFVLTGSLVAVNIFPLPSQAQPSVVDFLPRPLQDALQNPVPQPMQPVLPSLPPLPPLPEEQLGNPLIDLTPPAPLDIPRTTAATYLIAIDVVHLEKNVKFSLTEVETAAGPKTAIRIDAHRAVLDNLMVQFPGHTATVGDHIKRSASGYISTLEGNFHIIVQSLDVKAGTKAGGIIPLKLDASMSPEEIKAQLFALGLGTPDIISDQLYLHEVKLDTYFVGSDKLILGSENRISPA